MEILKRAKGMSSDLASFTESESAVKEEVNRRTCKAGYTDRDGQPPLRKVSTNGKGDWYRNVNKTKYEENYSKIDWSK